MESGSTWMRTASSLRLERTRCSSPSAFDRAGPWARGTRTTARHEEGAIGFRENMVIVIQPNVITQDEKMGLQFGETLVVRKNGCESLNKFPREWIVCRD